ncbi:MAG: O-antigen ligase family protein [Elusimicrobia bacterium]|nr:O-antigen ligase family protein [Elusimicrobiota bacterium]MDE2236443.1 O-antigen ligase family protein [Elusimicrobiota bacterium]MDE2425800.1 O-antigen ligase family protein [Elusimicrobiota bacterium]
MSAAAALLALLYAGLMADGLRPDWAWAVGGLWLGGCLWACRRRSARPLAVWLPYLAWALLSAAACGGRLAGLGALSRWAGALAFYAAAVTLWRPRHRRRWLKILLLAGPLLGLAALATGWTQVRVYGSGESMTGFLPPYYNYTCFVLAACGAAALGALGGEAEAGGLLARPALGVVAGLCASLLVVARARSALLGLLAGAVVAAYRQHSGRVLKLAAALLGGSAVVFTAAMMALHVSGPLLMLKLDKAKAFKRPQLWLAAAQVIADHPVLGEGPGQFESGFRRHVFAAGYGVARYRFTTAYAHSEPLQLAADTGLVGAVLWAGGLWASLGPAGASLEAQAAVAAAAAMTVPLAFDNMLQLPALAFLFFSALAVGFSDERRQEDRAAPRGWAAAALLVGVLALAAAAAARVRVELSKESGPPAARLARARRREDLWPRDPGGFQAQARADMGMRPARVEEALSALRRASALAPYDAFVLVWGAELQRARGAWPQARKLALRALELEPDFLQARLLLAESLLRQRPAAARAELSELERRRAALRAEGLYGPERSRFTDYDRQLGSLDQRREALLRAALHS